MAVNEASASRSGKLTRFDSGYALTSARSSFPSGVNDGDPVPTCPEKPLPKFSLSLLDLERNEGPTCSGEL